MQHVWHYKQTHPPEVTNRSSQFTTRDDYALACLIGIRFNILLNVSDLHSSFWGRFYGSDDPTNSIIDQESSSRFLDRPLVKVNFRFSCECKQNRMAVKLLLGLILLVLLVLVLVLLLLLVLLQLQQLILLLGNLALSKT